MPGTVEAAAEAAGRGESSDTSQVGVAGLVNMASSTLAMVFMAGAFLPTARGVRPDGDTPLTCGVAQFAQHLASHKAASHSADGPYRNVGLYQELKELAASRHPMRVVGASARRGGFLS